MRENFTVNPNVLFRRLEDRMVLVHLATNHIFELNETGARIWELLQEGTPTEDLVAKMSSEFETDTKILKEEVENLINDLQAQELIKR